MNTRFQSFRLVFCLLVLAANGATAADKPLKVFILAGQSNMQGHARVATFDSMADDPKTAPLLREMRGADGKPLVFENAPQPAQIYPPKTTREKKVPLAWSSFTTPTALDDATFGYKWAKDTAAYRP